jgi:hypothetical protein
LEKRELNEALLGRGKSSDLKTNRKSLSKKSVRKKDIFILIFEFQLSGSIQKLVMITFKFKKFIELSGRVDIKSQMFSMEINCFQLIFFNVYSALWKKEN